MLRVIINIVVLVLLFRFFRALVGRARSVLGGGSGPQPDPEQKPQDDLPPYSDLSPYEIEDADYDEIRPGRDS